MAHSLQIRLVGILIVLVIAVASSGCGGSSSNAPSVGSLQVLNSTGVDLVNVEIWQSGGMVTELGTGLALGASWTFTGLAEGIYEVRAFRGGGGIQPILFYMDNQVVGGQTTSLTMTP